MGFLDKAWDVAKGFIPSAVSGGFQMGGSALKMRHYKKLARDDRKFQKKMWEKNAVQQERFAKMGTRWEVDALRSAGINPLGAFSGGEAFAPQAVIPGQQEVNPYADALSNIGQDISRAISAKETKYERRLKEITIKTAEADLEKRRLANLESRARMFQSQPPMPPVNGGLTEAMFNDLPSNITEKDLQPDVVKQRNYRFFVDKYGHAEIAPTQEYAESVGEAAPHMIVANVIKDIKGSWKAGRGKIPRRDRVMMRKILDELTNEIPPSRGYQWRLNPYRGYIYQVSEKKIGKPRGILDEE